MPSRATRPSDHTQPPLRRTLLLFALAVILPGLVLTALGIVTLRQDRSLADQQVRERRDALADRAATALETELRGWDAAQVALSRDTSPDPVTFPPLIRTALARSSLAVYFAQGPAGTSAWPDRRLLYGVDNSALPTLKPLAPALAAAERIELEKRDLVRAAAVYKALSASTPPTARADVLVRLARTYRNAGREDLADATYQDLARLGGTTSDGVPVELLARCALCVATPAAGRDTCALGIYRDLVDGRWHLDRIWYWAYSGQVRGLLDGGSPHIAEVNTLAAREAEKRSLTRAVEAVVAESRTGKALTPTRELSMDDQTFLVLAGESAGGLRAVVLSASALTEHVWPAVFSSIVDEVDVTLADSAGAQLFASRGSPVAPAPESPLTTARLVRHAGLTWKIDVGLRDPDLLLAGFRRRQWLYVAMLAVMMASLAAGTVLTLRTISRELAVARLKSQFVSAVSHEFRTPLTGIRHYGEMLLHDRVATEERKRHYYSQVLAAAGRLSRLVEDVLDIARVEDGRQQYRIESIETAAWLQQTVAEFQATLDQGKRIEAAIPENLGSIQGDGPALARAIHNLLDNAVKYSPGCDTVWLEARQDGSGVAVSVRDLGIGISASDRPHIFERFYRGHSSDGSTRGTGLGLSLVQHVVSAHGGSIDVASEPGQGTTVTIRLPRTSTPSGIPCAS